MKENVVSLKTRPEVELGKVIAAPDSALRKLAESLAACTTALATAERELRAADDVLAEAAPAGFDHVAAARMVAEARVVDLLQGGSTVDGVQDRLDRERVAAEAASAAHAKRQTDAMGQVERAGQMVAVLRAQAQELDRAVRRELAKLGGEMEAAAAQALADAVAEYSRALVEFRAIVWLQHAETVGDGARQFTALSETDLALIVPTELHEGLPAGWEATSTRNMVRRDRYDLAGAVGERRREIMEEVTGGIYPRAGAGLHRVDRAGEAS